MKEKGGGGYPQVKLSAKYNFRCSNIGGTFTNNIKIGSEEVGRGTKI